MPSPEQHSQVVSRAQGCLLGQLAGDALGSMVEFRSGASILEQYPDGLREIGPSTLWGTLAGQPTDDSELALALARTLVQGGFSDEAVARAYGDWLRSDPFDIGGTIAQATRAIVSAMQKGGSAADAARSAANQASEANGALMRQSPLAIWGQALDPLSLDAYVRADTTLTHPNQVCQDASALFVVTIAAVVREGLEPQAAYEYAAAWAARYGKSPTVHDALALARNAPPQYEVHQGHVLIALQNAFYQLLHTDELEEGVVSSVMGGGDTDTNAAIAGALLGAVYGVEAIPRQWREAILNCRPASGAPGVKRPRSEAYWPADALELANQLLAAGEAAADRP